jgi:hypothetical protein
LVITMPSPASRLGRGTNTKEAPMGLLIRNVLAVLPAGQAHAVARHDLYVEGNQIAGIDEEP